MENQAASHLDVPLVASVYMPEGVAPPVRLQCLRQTGHIVWECRVFLHERGKVKLFWVCSIHSKISVLMVDYCM